MSAGGGGGCGRQVPALAGDERLQLKWFTWAVALALGLQAVLLPVAPVSQAGQLLFDAALVVGIGLALPLAVGVAVLKYRLYAIDRIISRTVSYVLVTGLVVGVYLGCVALLTRVLPVHGNVGIALAVLVAAAVFNPLRRRVQAGVDRLLGVVDQVLAPEHLAVWLPPPGESRRKVRFPEIRLRKFRFRNIQFRKVRRGHDP